MLLLSVIANFILLFLLICLVVKPNIKHVMIGASFVAPYLFIAWYFFFNGHSSYGNPTWAIVSMLIFAFIALANYFNRKTKDKNGQTFSFIVFLFMFWSPLLILLPYVTK